MLIIGSSESAAGGRAIRLPGLPDFNAGDPTFKINVFEGWFDGVRPIPTLVANGGGPGAVAVGDWDPAERVYTLGGRIDAAGASRSTFRQMLLTAFPADREVSIAVLGNGVDVDLQVFVRLYDVPTFPHGESVLRFTFPLVAPDPYKYGLTEITAFAGGFEPEDWFRVYTEDAGDWYRTYADDGAIHYRNYLEAEADTSSLPRTAVLTSDGDATSQRLTMAVQGPVTLGEWFIERVDDGSRIWVDTSLAVGQELVLDSSTRTARLDGSDVDHLVYGDFQTLRPGSNAWRLVVGSSGAGSSMSVTGLPAHL